MNNLAKIENALVKMPLVAILRGVKPHEVIDVADVLVKAGITVLEVPLNSPDAFDSILKLRKHLPAAILVGGGTVLQVSEVSKLHACGAQFVVSPNTKPSVIESALQHDMVPIPGFYTPTEAMLAIDSGAVLLKLFPVNTHTDNFVSGLKSVLPAQCKLLAVGGINVENSQRYMQLGLTALGLGKSLYYSGMDLAEIEHRAKMFVAMFSAKSL